MPYSPEIQARIDAELAGSVSKGPSFPMPRLRHNGETGEWLVREVEGDKNSDTVTVFDRPGMEEKVITNDKGETHNGMVGGQWDGVVVRVAYMSQSKYKPDAVFQKFTREFTNWKTEPIEVMKRVFGPAGRTESVKTFANYQEFKAASMLKDEEGNEAGSAYDLKVVLYVWHPIRKQIVKLVVGGTARSEWFAYDKFYEQEEEGIVSSPWRVTVPGARHLQEVVTTFCMSEDETPKGLKYFRLSFAAQRFTSDDEMTEVLDVSRKVKNWVEAWAKVTEEKKAETAPAAVASLEDINRMAPQAHAVGASASVPAGVDPHAPMPMAAAMGPMPRRPEPDDQEIRIEDIPF